jgi:glycosyltransferase involved in cell wall biosynthesis
LGGRIPGVGLTLQIAAPEPTPRAARVLFVGGLSPVPDGSAGGNVTAATTLLNQGLGEGIEFVTLSTTMVSNPPPPPARRAVTAIGRFATFCSLARRCDAILIFTSDGLSFVEKGVMCLIAAMLRKPTILRPGGGRLAQQCRQSPIFSWWVRLVLRHVSVLTCQSSYWVEFARCFAGGATRIVEIGNGVALDALPIDRVHGTLNVGYLGMTGREKGVFDALSAFQRVLVEVPGAVLRVAGGGGDYQAFVAEVKRGCLEEHVVCLGWLPHDEIPSFLETLNVLVLPSYAEGLPNALLEAMAVGVPVVATCVGGVTDLVGQSGGGILVEPGAIESIAKAITTLLKDARLNNEIGVKGQKFVRERHDIRLVAAKYRDAVMSVLPPRTFRPATRSTAVGAAVRPSAFR